MTGSIPIKDVVYDTSIYPRDKWNANTVKTYVEAMKGGAQFPPIVLEQDTKRILDGVHRWKAYLTYAEEYAERAKQQRLESMGQEDEWPEPIVDIQVVWHAVPEGVPIKLYAASLSAKHGDRLTPAHYKAIAREIFTENPEYSLATLCEYLPVSKSSAGDYVADIRARRREQQRMIAYRLHRLGWTQEEIGEAIGVERSVYAKGFLCEFPDLENATKKLLDSGIPHLEVAERYNMPLILVWAIDLHGRTDEQRFERLGIKSQPYDVWNFSQSNDLFGADYPGRIPGQLIAHVLYFFTKPGDVVIDPMAGSGTTQDVCLAMGRKCYAYDLDNRHERSDVILHNLSTNEWPDRLKKADLLFWDPPYFKKKDKLMAGEDGYVDGSISAMSRDDYLAFFAGRLKQAKEKVKPGTRLAFLMSDWDDPAGPAEGVFVWDYADIIRDAGWSLRKHIQVPLSTQQVHPDIVKKFRASRRLARLERYLLIGDA